MIPSTSAIRMMTAAGSFRFIASPFPAMFRRGHATPESRSFPARDVGVNDPLEQRERHDDCKERGTSAFREAFHGRSLADADSRRVKRLTACRAEATRSGPTIAPQEVLHAPYHHCRNSCSRKP